MVLTLIYLLFPMFRAWRNRVTPLDWLCAAASIGVVAYILWQGTEFGERAIDPEPLDFYVGVVLILLLLEATRRSTGWIMPVVALIFIAYALFGKYLPPPWTHRGYTFERLVGHLYMTLEGVFGTTVEVSSSLIILFTIFGAILQYSGAGKFFIDFSFAAMGGKRNAAGRSVVLSSFLLGGPSGSGVATTVTIGTVAYPLLEKAGYEKNAAGGLLAAGGLGAIISPPVLGAAAFLIAEFLKISYLDVIWMAAIPTILYYFSILVMVELDAAKYGGGGELLVREGHAVAHHARATGSTSARSSPSSPSCSTASRRCCRCSGPPCWRSPSATCAATRRWCRPSWCARWPRAPPACSASPPPAPPPASSSASPR